MKSHHQVKPRRHRQQLRAVFGAGSGIFPVQSADRADVPVALFLIEVGSGNVGMAQRREVERLALEQINRRATLVACRRRIIQNVQLFARQHVAHGGVGYAINRAEVAAAQTLRHVVAIFDLVADAMLQKPDFGHDCRLHRSLHNRIVGRRKKRHGQSLTLPRLGAKD